MKFLIINVQEIWFGVDGGDNRPKKKKEVKEVLDNLVATHVLFLAKCHKHKQTLKRENKFEKYETLFKSMGMHVKCSRIYQVRISFDRHPTRYYYMEVPILCKTLGPTTTLQFSLVFGWDIQLQPFP